MEQFPVLNPDKKPKKKMGKAMKWLGAAGIVAGASLAIDKTPSRPSELILNEPQTNERLNEPTSPPILEGRLKKISSETTGKIIDKDELPNFEIPKTIAHTDTEIARSIKAEIMQVRTLLADLKYRDELERLGENIASKREQTINKILQVLAENLNDYLEEVGDSDIRRECVAYWTQLANFVRGRGYAVTTESPREN